MAITLGIMFHMDRAPAAPVPPLVSSVGPIIEAAVVSPVQATVSPIEASNKGQFRQGYPSPSARPFPTYDLNGAKRISSDLTGVNLDIFA